EKSELQEGVPADCARSASDRLTLSASHRVSHVPPLTRIADRDVHAALRGLGDHRSHCAHAAAVAADADRVTGVIAEETLYIVHPKGGGRGIGKGINPGPAKGRNLQGF